MGVVHDARPSSLDQDVIHVHHLEVLLAGASPGRESGCAELRVAEMTRARVGSQAVAHRGVGTLVAGMRLLADELEQAAAESVGESDAERLAQAAARLRVSAVRPLELGADAIQGGTSGGLSRGRSRRPQESGRAVADGMWQLAKEATRLRVRAGASNALLEATAALQDLAIQFAHAVEPDVAAGRLTELERIQRRLPESIRSALDGPYLVTNASSFRDWLGVELPRRPQMALCRCGASRLKPLCDGSHAAIGFSGAKDRKRVPDRQASYRGQQVTVLDNRGTCAHSGFCTESLPDVFHTDSDPFVTPSGGRMDDIGRAVRACPSGALS
jgi:CDGSH-type Zn-finger protein/ferredoxin